MRLSLAISPYYYVICAILTTVFAQIFIKVAGQCGFFSIKWFLFIASSLFSYGISFVCYYMAVKYFDISKVVPIMMASTMLLIVFYGLVIGETINHIRMAGLFLAVLSIFLLSKS